MESLRTVVSRLFVDIHDTPTQVNYFFSPFFPLLFYFLEYTSILKLMYSIGLEKCRKTNNIWVIKKWEKKFRIEINF